MRWCRERHADARSKLFIDTPLLLLLLLLRSSRVLTIVKFANADSVTKAMVLDKATINGKTVSVRALRPRREPAAAAAANVTIAAKAPAGKGKGRAAAPAAAAAARVPRSEGAVIPDSVAVLGLRNVPPQEIADHFGSCGEIDSIRFVFRG